MKLDEYLEQFPNARQCLEKDNQIIINFLKDIPMDLGLFSLSYDRAPNFFSYFKEVPGEVFTIMLFDKNEDDIVGIGCINKRACNIRGKQMFYYYNSDLRVKRGISSELKTQWRLCHAGIQENLLEIEELGEKGPFYCAILDQNKKAIDALTKKYDELKFSPMKRYSSVNILGRVPTFSISFSNKYKVEKVLEIKKEHFDFVQTELTKRPLSDVKLKLDFPYFVVKDKNEQIICTFNLYRSKNRKLIARNVNSALKLVGKFFPLLSGKAIVEGENFIMLYLSNLVFKEDLLEVEKQKIILNILKYIYRHKLNIGAHVICIPSFPEEGLDKKLAKAGYIYQKVDGTLFQMVHKNRVKKDLLYTFNKGELPFINLATY